MAEKGVFLGTGRRKKSIARVRILAGDGKIVVNGKDIEEYFKNENSKTIIRQPFAVLDKEGKYDVLVNVRGGGLSGQAEAIRHGISRALLEADEDNRKELKTHGFLTRDPRMKERKKYGLKKARKAPQFSKR